jgi:hypothetical protein
MDSQEVIWVSTKLNKIRETSTGFRQEAILKNGTASVTPVRPVVAHGPEFEAKYTSTMLGRRSKV